MTPCIHNYVEQLYLYPAPDERGPWDMNYLERCEKCRYYIGITLPADWKYSPPNLNHKRSCPSHYGVVGCSCKPPISAKS